MRTVHHKKFKYYIYVDKKNKRWNGRVCPDCSRTECKINKRKSSSGLTRDQVKHPTWIKGLAAERIAAKFFKKQGYKVVMTEAIGPDLIISKKGKRKLKVEVKSVIEGTRNRWRVSPVYPNRKNDDLIAVVFSDKTVIIEPMKKHLRKCAKNGSRAVISLYPKYVPKPRSIHG